MTTVAELIEFLKTQDQGAEVHVLKERHWWPGAEFESLDLVEDVDYTDLRGNPHVLPGQPCYGKRYLELGSK